MHVYIVLFSFVCLLVFFNVVFPVIHESMNKITVAQCFFFGVTEECKFVRDQWREFVIGMFVQFQPVLSNLVLATAHHLVLPNDGQDRDVRNGHGIGCGQ